MESHLKQSNLIRDIGIIIGICLVISLNIIQLEQYYFCTVFVGIVCITIHNLFRRNKILLNTIIGIVSVAMLVVLLWNRNFYNRWYEYDSVWVLIAKTAVNILLVATVFLYAFWHKKTSPDARVCAVARLLLVLLQVFYCAFAVHFTINYSLGISAKAVMTDFILCFLAVLILCMIIGNYIWGTFAFSTVVTVFAVVNHFVFEFRGTPIIYNDLFAAGTAKNVASGYGYFVTGEITLVLLFFVFVFISTLCLQSNNNNKLWKKSAIPFRVVVVIACFVFVSKINHIDLEDSDSLYHLSKIAWDPMFGYNKDGIIKTIIQTRNCSVLHKPKGYSKEALSEVEQYSVSNSLLADTKPKNIIVIMNESWSDLSVALPIETNVSYNTFYSGMNQNVIKGNALASVWGGGTCNSEYEFLLGNSMWYTPGTYPYQTFIKEGVPSLVSTLEAQGYHSIAIHPLEKENWNRENVYQYLGFDEMHYDEIIEEEQLLSYMERGLLSDEGLYEYIKRSLEEASNEYNFVFAVTIQNHGGYTDSNYENEVVCEEYDSYELNQYLTLQKQTDEAIKQLIEYYEEKEPTVIVMFGDHQPIFTESAMKDYTLAARESKDIEQEEKIYKVPYFIWTNYGDFAFREKDTSLNFLGTNLLEVTGLQMTGYHCFLVELQKYIKAMNTIGYQDASGNYCSYEEMDSEVEKKLELYKKLMYNQLKNNNQTNKDIFYLQGGSK